MRRGNRCVEPSKQPPAFARLRRQTTFPKTTDSVFVKLCWFVVGLSSALCALFKGTFVTVQDLWLSGIYCGNDVFYTCGHKSIITVILWLINTLLGAAKILIKVTACPCPPQNTHISVFCRYYDDVFWVYLTQYQWILFSLTFFFCFGHGLIKMIKGDITTSTAVSLNQAF